MRKSVAIGMIAALCGIVAPARTRAQETPAAAPAFQIFGVFGFFSPDLPTNVMQADDGNFYGTTLEGALGDRVPTIYKMTPGGVITAIHTFDPGEGSEPFTRLVQARDGALYGTGGNVVFKVTLEGAFTVIHRFTGPDGSTPNDLIQGRDGNFYGTTQRGGDSDVGTVFRMATDGSVTTLHSFAIGEGIVPVAGLVEGADGNFYGTTFWGGDSAFGTVFKMTPDGTPTFLHHFSGAGGDGALLTSAVIQGRDGALYGVTYNGGLSGHGVVFRLTTSGSFSVLRDFVGYPSGGNPSTPLVQTTDGSLYGTATNGSDAQIFRIDPAGAYSVQHTFGLFEGGGLAGLLHGRDGSLYGVGQSSLVGEVDQSRGTAFRLLNPASCDDQLTLGYDNGTLNLSFTLRAEAPATWLAWLVSGTTVTPLWSTPIPAVSPAAFFTVPLSPFPPSGNLTVLTALVNSSPSACVDWKVVDTGGDPARAGASVSRRQPSARTGGTAR
jgi:uncharacterized repeat protein (TIGR03803 family)